MKRFFESLFIVLLAVVGLPMTSYVFAQVFLPEDVIVKEETIDTFYDDSVSVKAILATSSLSRVDAEKVDFDQRQTKEITSRLDLIIHELQFQNARIK